jgi:hypothetical protein
MSLKTYKLYCEICNWCIITNGTEIEEKLYELKTSPIPKGIPHLDPVENKVVNKSSQKQIRKFRCPQCGRVIIPKKIKDEQIEINSKKEVKERKSNEQDWADGRQERSKGSEIS